MCSIMELRKDDHKDELAKTTSKAKSDFRSSEVSLMNFL